jgi:hypothetical protein
MPARPDRAGGRGVIDVRVTGDAEVERAVHAFGVAISDLRGFWPSVVPLFISWMREQFAAEGAWGGASWAPLTPRYAAWKAKKYPGRSILYATGDLRRAASSPGRFATPSTLTLSIQDPKAGYHQDGTSKMPARPIIPGRLPMGALRELDQAADEWVGDVAGRLGL